MPIAELKPSLDLRDLLPILVFTRARLAADPAAAALVAPFDDLRAQWIVVHQQEIDLEAAIANCASKVTACDDDLDDFVKRFAPRLLAAAKDDRKSPLFKMFFGAQKPSLFARPTLGRQLASMANWVAPLKASQNPELASFGAELEPLIAAAKAAEAALAAAETSLDTFKISGARLVFLNHVNAARNTTRGALADIAYKRDDLGLSSDYPDRFFPHTRRARPDAKTKAQLATAIDKAQAVVDDLKRQLAGVEADEVAAEQAEAQEVANQARVDAAQKVVDQAEAALEAAKAQLEGAKKTPSATPVAPSGGAAGAPTEHP